MELMAFLTDRSQTELLVCDIVDSNGKTLLHECTFNDSSKCLKALLAHAKSQNLNP